MSLHEQLYQYTSQGGLDASSARRLWQLSGQGLAPDRWMWWMKCGAAALAAGLVGFGVMLWVAANWDAFTRFERFAMLQGLLGLAVVGAVIVPTFSAASIHANPSVPGSAPGGRWVSPANVTSSAASPVVSALALLSFLTLGGLLAYFGQTYQTGADAWNLFALWAALAVPLLLAVPSDLLWMPWQVVTSLAISLWAYTYAGHEWSVVPQTLPVHAIALALSALLIGVLGVHGRLSGHWWAWRMSVLCACVLALGIGIGSLFRTAIAPQYAMVLGLLGIAMALAWWRREVFAMSVVALVLNVLLLGGWIHSRSLRAFDELLLVAGLAAVLLAGSVRLILQRSRSARSGDFTEGAA
ncbi:DUF2157 domain-containing protein [Roseateles terrae]|uniref:Membrane protein n=1 Tax=Roseateles terrae TaxID=431060 RepID=A0ABR6GRD7_9BURK|nr:DUF2157 domain-containing protein [Roseateles terrae]MBB3194634.1 putative membrane protein [Roseateles terrae]